MNTPVNTKSPWKAEEKVGEMIEKICYCELLGGDKCEECSVGKVIMKAEDHRTLVEKMQAPKRCQNA
jgi:hypothetical protein